MTKGKEQNASATVIGLLIFMAVGWWWFFGGGSARQVTYKVTGTASAASVTYRNPQGGTVQSEIKVPWEQTMLFNDGDFTYIAAQNKGESGSITTEILIDGTPWKKTTSNGGYTIAESNGAVAKP